MSWHGCAESLLWILPDRMRATFADEATAVAPKIRKKFTALQEARVSGLIRTLEAACRSR